MARDQLTRDQIVKAAIELLDAEGLEGLNMRDLGRRLRSAATAVYWHVGSKDALIALAADEAWHEAELPDPAELGWREAAYRMAASLHAMFTRHPWLVQAFGTYPIYGPGKARHDDHALGVYEAGGFAGIEADQAAAAVFTFVLGSALGVAAQAAFTRKLAREGNAEESARAHQADAVAVAMEFPRLRSRVESPSAGYAAGPEGGFEFGLRAVLTGLESGRR